MKQAHVYYSGHVQGVGFRYTTVDIARGFAVTGWVRNLTDGRVEVVAEGEEAAVAEFLAAVRNGPLQRYIADATVTWQDATQQYHDFHTAPSAP